MLNLTLRTINANRIRLTLTAFAVVLGVSFVVSSFVLGDGLRSSFGTLSEEIVGGTDLEIRPTSEFGSVAPLDGALAATVGSIEGIERVEGIVSAQPVQPVTDDGSPVTTAGPPLIGFSWIDDPLMSSFVVVGGRAPVSGMEFTIDRDSAAAFGFEVGRFYEVITPTGTHELELVGVTRFGESNATLGAVLTQYPLETAQRMFDRPGQFDSVLVRYQPGADGAAVLDAVEAAMPDNARAVGQSALVAETNADFNEGIDIFNNILLAFAGVALFVSIFIIANTFAIVLGQRTRELALLRALGASGAQVQRSALGEALIVGLVASVAGLLGGIGLTYGLRALFDALGAGLPDSPFILQPRTVVLAFVIGVGVTVLSAFGPARRAARVAPIAALRDSVDSPAGVSAQRSLAGLAIMAAGAASGGLGLFGDPGGLAERFTLLGLGAAGIFVGVALSSPAAARPVLSVVGAPLRVLGVPGHLSTRNAARNPRRTSSTAASLTVGLALVTMALVMGESIKASVSDTLAGSVHADYVSLADDDFTPRIARDLARQDAFAAVSGYRYDEVSFDGEVSLAVGSDLVTTGQLFDLGLVDGALSSDPRAVVVHVDEAARRGYEVGDPIDVAFPNGSTDRFTVAAIFETNTILDEDYLIGLDRWGERFGTNSDSWVAMKLADGATSVDAQRVFASMEERYPQFVVEDRTEYQASVEAEIDQLLVAINAMLVLAIVVALIGIANTLALSVFERTGELGLLRAVGMTPSQTRRMIRYEAAQVALFGTSIGVAVGVMFGWAVTAALPDSFVYTVAVPVARIAVLIGICTAAGLLAAALPARRAGRLDVLDAVAHG